MQKIKNLYHLVVAILANMYYGFPSRNVKVIGVTGTDGKTTTTALIYHILTTSGKKASMVSTVYAKVGAKEYDTGFHVSTPHSFTVQKFLRESVENGDEYFVMETTSHALDQNRVLGVDYRISVITNITHEHLDYHKDYAEYVDAKSKLLRASKMRIINHDDDSYKMLGKEFTKNTITYGLKKGNICFDISTKIGKKLPEFNKYNYLAAYTVCHELGLSDEQIYAAMKTYILPPGRMDILMEKPVTAIVDFAHTPNSIKVALEAVKEEFGQNGRIIHIFSSAAKRDEAKRPLMGTESGKYADLVILTEEDYRDEDVEHINDQIAEGLKQQGFVKKENNVFGTEKKTYTYITDRKKAIEKAVEIAQTGDIIIATGKGHEKSLCRGSVEYPWDEQKVMLNELKKQYGSTL